ncbi:MAG: alpha-amylase/4-alpha-glucanotransferase domain-containing protein [bacterium]
MKQITLILSIHCHQPVGNFDYVFEEAYQKAYLPFIKVLEKHPDIKLSLHYSGSLLNWFLEKHPEIISKVKKLIQQGQVEILTGGFYEPILPAIPDRDKIGQIQKLTNTIKNYFGIIPKGMWLAERVWEPSLSKPIGEAGVEFTLVDDAHFKWVGIKEKDLFGYYVTEEEGVAIKIFPISQKLRYLIPFAPKVDNVLEYLQSVADENVTKMILMGDDGEKFGIWPNTYEWVYEKGWLDNFFTALENADWIKMTTLSGWIMKNNSLGRVYLPCAAYEELMQWALPSHSLIEYEKVIADLSHSKKYQSYIQFMKGSFWRNFLIKYPEANNMHKKMLYVSNKVDQISQASEVLVYTEDNKFIDNRPISIDRAKEELWQGQCNCAYWHGIFGGLYLPHLRNAIYQHLINAEVISENIIHNTPGWIEIEAIDFDKDGEKEILVSNSYLNLYFQPLKGGTLFELDYKPKLCNITNTLSRKEETYHQKIKQAEISRKSTGVATIHEQLSTKQQDLDKYLTYDSHQRGCLIDHFLPKDITLDNFSRGNYKEVCDFINQPYKHKVRQGKEEIIVDMAKEGKVLVNEEALSIGLIKSVRILARNSEIEITYEIRNDDKKDISLWFGIEFNLSLVGGTQCFYIIPEMENLKDNKMDSIAEDVDCKEITLRDNIGKIEIDFKFNQPCCLWRFPVYTVSSSEAGLELGYQGSVFFPNWKIEIPPYNSWQVKIKKDIKGIV